MAGGFDSPFPTTVRISNLDKVKSRGKRHDVSAGKPGPQLWLGSGPPGVRRSNDVNAGRNLSLLGQNQGKGVKCLDLRNLP